MNKTRNKKIYSFSILSNILVAAFLAYIISNLFFSAVLFAIIGLALIFFAGQDYARLNRMAHEYKHGSQNNAQSNPFKSNFNPQNNTNFGNNTKKESPLADFYMKQERPINFQENEQNNNEDTIFYDSEYAASDTIFVNKKDDASLLSLQALWLDSSLSSYSSNLTIWLKKIRLTFWVHLAQVQLSKIPSLT